MDADRRNKLKNNNDINDEHKHPENVSHKGMTPSKDSPIGHGNEWATLGKLG